MFKWKTVQKEVLASNEYVLWWFWLSSWISFSVISMLTLFNQIGILISDSGFGKSWKFYVQTTYCMWNSPPFLFRMVFWKSTWRFFPISWHCTMHNFSLFQNINSKSRVPIWKNKANLEKILKMNFMVTRKSLENVLIRGEQLLFLHKHVISFFDN